MFGNFVTESLLEMDPTTRKIAQNQISNVIIQAQMGYLGQDHGAMNYSQPNEWMSSGFQASTGMNHFGQSGCWTQRAQHQSSQLFNGPRVSTELSQKDDLNEYATKDQDDENDSDVDDTDDDKEFDESKNNKVWVDSDTGPEDEYWGRTQPYDRLKTIILNHQIVHYKSLGLKVLPNNVSKTSLPQTWHKPRTKDINPEPISSLQIQKPVKFAKKKLQSNGDKIEDKRTKERDNSICIEPTVYNPLQDEDYSAKKFIADFKKSFASGPKTQFSYILDADQEDNLVSSSYGMLPKGSVISYHFPLKEVDNFCKLKDTPTFPAIPLYSLSRVYSTVFDRNSIEIFEKNIVTEEEAISIENETREQSVTPLWHEMRCSRITSTKFKRIVSRRDNFAKLALDLVSTKNIQTAAMRRGIACERKWLLLHI
eukprot:gene4026-20195_t